LPDPNPLPAGDDALQVVRRYMAHYPERTYPSVNDTSLEQHCRLSGILAFVVYRNLERNKSGLLEQDITYDGEEIHYPEENPEGVVQKHLQASLVRVAFEGHRSQYKSAGRVDDLLGARAQTDRTRKAFKLALAKELDAPDLADQLTISESQFDLVYLLPGEEAQAKEYIRAAYERALDRVAAEVADELERDFPQISGERAELRRQLGEIAYGVSVVPLAVPEMGSGSFGEFAAEYGRQLLNAYQASLKYAIYPWLDGGNRVEGSSPGGTALTETCQACGNFPPLVPTEGLNDEERARWERGRDYAAHTFRGEREQLCLSCVTRRTLSHGEIARQVDPIVHPMWEPAGAGGWRLIRPSDGPDVPPLSATFVGLSGDQVMEDAGAFFIRCRAQRPGADCSQIDIFPTTTYAADANGNLVLLALRPRPGTLFACYPYDEAIAAFDPEEELPSSGGLVEMWQASFVDFHNPIRKKYERDLHKAQGGSEQSQQKIPDPSEPIRHVHPHLARVMERIQHIRRFYVDLYKHLAEDSPRLRVLPLDTDYPTLRLLVPADQLDEVLDRLEQAVTETLLSARAAGEEHQTLHGLLKLLAPDLLHGAIILFKHKFPLYLALEAERDLFRQLQSSDPADRRDERKCPGNAQWYGLRLAFTDLRGTLSQVGPTLAEVTYADLGTALNLVQDVDRRTVLLRAETAQYLSGELADAQVIKRANRIGLARQQAELLNQERTFPPVLFIKQAIRR
jgi:hypothetical protein